ncbi:unnamed protein product, partial [Musa hybrid cultivar]
MRPAFARPPRHGWPLCHRLHPFHGRSFLDLSCQLQKEASGTDNANPPSLSPRRSTACFAELGLRSSFSITYGGTEQSKAEAKASTKSMYGSIFCDECSPSQLGRLAAEDQCLCLTPNNTRQSI